MQDVRKGSAEGEDYKRTPNVNYFHSVPRIGEGDAFKCSREAICLNCCIEAVVP